MDITEILLAIIGLIGTIITAVAVPLIRQKLTTEQQAELAKWVRIAVSAAEQLKDTQVIQDKHAYVMKWLAANGFDMDDAKVAAEVELLIESFVAEMNGKAALMR